MNNKKQKLELTWIGKDEQPRLEPRILIEDPERSYGHTPNPSQEGSMARDFLKVKFLALVCFLFFNML